MHPFVIIMPSFLLLGVLGVMIGTAFAPYFELASPDGQSKLASLTNDPATVKIARAWASALKTANSALSDETLTRFQVILQARLARHVCLTGDYPSSLRTSPWRSLLLKQVLKHAGLPKTLLSAKLKMLRRGPDVFMFKSGLPVPV